MAEKAKKNDISDFQKDILNESKFIKRGKFSGGYSYKVEELANSKYVISITRDIMAIPSAFLQINSKNKLNEIIDHLKTAKSRFELADIIFKAKMI